MSDRNDSMGPLVTGLLVCPDRALAQAFRAALPSAKVFQVLAEIDRYPSEQALGIRLRQVKPDVVFLDVATEWETSERLLKFVLAQPSHPEVVALSRERLPELVVQALRAGAAEFLTPPFSAEEQRGAAARIARLLAPQKREPIVQRGKLVVFSSTKPGCGASTLALHTAFWLGRVQAGRVLVIDLDLSAGILGFAAKLAPSRSVVDALKLSSQLGRGLWDSLVSHWYHLEVLPAPAVPEPELIDAAQLHDLLEFSRLGYSWVIVDTPVVLHRTSLLALSESDFGFLVTTSELASLHLARRAISALEQLGFDKQRLYVLVNRYRKQDGIGREDLERIFGVRIAAVFPGDFGAVHRAVSLGEPLDDGSQLARAIEAFAHQLSEGRFERIANAA